MKLKKLLRKAREQCCAYYIEEIEQATYDGKQWRVRGWILGPPGLPAYDWSEGRFNTYEECEEYINMKQWKRVEWNIAQLRKKYKRPSKHKEL